MPAPRAKQDGKMVTHMNQSTHYRHSEFAAARPTLPGIGARIGLFCLLAAAAMPAFSQLIPVGETAAAVNYVDSSRVSRNGDLRSVWVVLDLRKTSPTGARSIGALNEFNCKEHRFKTLASYDYAEPKADGKIIKTGGNSANWADIAPDSVAGSIREVVCGD